tara:strand:- start:1982 stop:2743 length:762 start_codon:yes stop_codon:yes gene_type:complete
MILSQEKFISINISIGSYSTILEELKELGASRKSSYVCVANVHMLIEAFTHPEFANIVNAGHIVTPDGMPLAKGIQFLYGYKQDRVAGMDLLPDLLQISKKAGLKVFFYGGTQNMLNKTQAFCETEFPGLKLVGMISPPFREVSLIEENEYIEKINASHANFVFVALGCPKQEKWMASMKGKINACMIGIGGALPVMIGMQKRAPSWMQKASLEWLYRMVQEPKRLFKRYFYTNSLFLYLFLKELLITKFKKK